MASRALIVLLLVLGQWQPARAAAKAPRKTLHTSFFVYLEKGGWAERNLSMVEMGSKAGWACKAGEIELSEGNRLPGEDVQFSKTAIVVCLAENGTKIELLPFCDVGYPNSDRLHLRLYGKGGDFAVVTAECRTVYK
jgi:hypothetical protein